MKFQKVLLLIVILFGVFCTFKSPSDPDFGWHYKYGEYLIQHGHILRENIFSYTFTDYKWANSYWISQATIYLSHYYLGHLLAGLLFAIVLSASTIYYVKTISKNFQPIMPLMVFSCLLLFLEFSIYVITGRPMYFSSIFLMFLVVILLRENRKGYLWFLPSLFLIWANTHADFVLGLVILGLFIVDKLLERPLLKITKEKVMIVAIGLFSVVVTLVNPYGVGLWQTLIKESYPFQFNHISEWVPVTTGNVYYFATYCALLGIFVSALIGARHKLPLWYVLSLGLFCIFSVRSQYFFRIAAILGIYAFLVFWSPYLRDLKNTFSPGLLKKFKAGFLTFLTISTLVVVTVFLTEISPKQKYPKEALDFALANNIQGNVFNYYSWGGYMIWEYPQIKTFIDGRMPSWREGSKSVFEDYVKVVDTPRENIKILDNYNVNWILYPASSSLSKFLRGPNSGWKEIYSDDIASVFVKTPGFVETTRFDIMSP